MNFWPKGAATEPGGAAPESGIVLVDIIFWYNYRYRLEDPPLTHQRTTNIVQQLMENIFHR